MKDWTKKDKVACITIFVLAIVITITFVSSITMSYLFDTHSVTDAITAGRVELTFGGSNSNGQIKFDSVLKPNTTYASTSSDNSYTFTIKNSGTSGSVYIYVCVEGNDFITPIISRDWYGSTTEGHRNYYFYKTAVSQGATVTFCTAFRTLNFGNEYAGEAVTLNITVGAVQTQGNACKELISSGVEGWKYAPANFQSILG